FITAPEQEATQSSPDSFQTTSAEPPLPAPWQLQEAGQRALLAADSGDIDKSTIGPWTVEARLVRANQPACLKCHAADHTQGVYTIQVPPLTTSQITTSRSPGALHFFPAAPRPTPSPLHIGDAVGVAFYVYRREPASVMTRLLQQRKAFKDQAKSAVAVQAQVARSTAMATARR
ncbi:MAG: hypothetical protein JOZ57_12350, partial [Abitibacteriaceae bacterium]|nr:hypothetical protein [Abditibacteriaceae bacterium]